MKAALNWHPTPKQTQAFLAITTLVAIGIIDDYAGKRLVRKAAGAAGETKAMRWIGKQASAAANSRVVKGASRVSGKVADWATAPVRGAARLSWKVARTAWNAVPSFRAGEAAADEAADVDGSTDA